MARPLFKIFGEVFMKSDPADKSLNKLNKNARNSAKTIESIGKMAKIAGAAIVASLGFAAIKSAITGIWDLAKNTAQFGDDMLVLEEKTNISIKTLQKWNFAQELIDVSMETMTKSLGKLIKTMDASRAKKNNIFDELQVKIKGTDGQLRNSEETFYDVIDALNKIPNKTERNAKAFKIFGKSAMELNPLIEKGTKRLRDLGKQAEEAGLIFSKKELMDFAGLDDKIQIFEKKMDFLKLRMGQLFIPLVESAMKFMDPFISNLNLAIKEKDPKAVMATFSTFINDGLAWLQTTVLPTVIEVGGVLGQAFIDEFGFRISKGITALSTFGFSALFDSYIKKTTDKTVADIDAKTNKMILNNKISTGADLTAQEKATLTFPQLLDWTKKNKAWHKEHDKKTKADGSHRGGLSYVPFDGYRAILHKGERVLTAQENKSSGIVININNPKIFKTSDIDELGNALTKLLVRKGAIK